VQKLIKLNKSKRKTSKIIHMQLLLFSNSTNAGEEYLSYTHKYINNFLKHKSKKALFIPYAGISVGFDNYTEKVAACFHEHVEVFRSIHTMPDKQKALEEADLLIVGGGNTFYLLKMLQDEGLLPFIRKRVLSGLPYIGWSAGSNLACSTIRTTNDMPIVEPENLQALDLIHFQINPHYTDFNQPGHAGETREMRIEEFLLANPGMYVAGLREGTLLHCTENTIVLLGDKPCRMFRFGQTPKELQPGENLNFLIQ
jgi:dipeptidase E